MTQQEKNRELITKINEAAAVINRFPSGNYIIMDREYAEVVERHQKIKERCAKIENLLDE